MTSLWILNKKGNNVSHDDVKLAKIFEDFYTLTKNSIIKNTLEPYNI